MRCASARFLVHVRRARQGPAGRAFRRATRLATRALVFGVAPSVATDSLVDHRLADLVTVTHELLTSALVTATTTGVHDAIVVLRAVLK